MTTVELLCALAETSPVPILVTDATPERPGPLIVYANAAFAALTGHDPHDIVGRSPRLVQGRGTRRPALDAFAQCLAAGRRFHGHLANYRRDGSRYLVEIDCRPLLGAGGAVEHFVAFQREVIRRRGRPRGVPLARYEPLALTADVLPRALREADLFGETAPLGGAGPLGGTGIRGDGAS